MIGHKVGTKHCRLLIVAGITALALAMAGCGSSSSSSSASASSSAAATSASTSSASVSNTKAKFVLHAGLAFGAFKHWIYGPAKAGDFAHPTSHKLTVVKAIAAGALVYHELKLALAAAQADKTLSKLVAPLTALTGKIQSVASGIKSGNVNPSDITSANGAIGSLSSLASGAGAQIKNVVPSSL
jgi:hypothetical protein